jgi:hypothetical protein
VSIVRREVPTNLVLRILRKPDGERSVIVPRIAVYLSVHGMTSSSCRRPMSPSSTGSWSWILHRSQSRCVGSWMLPRHHTAQALNPPPAYPSNRSLPYDQIGPVPYRFMNGRRPV